MFMQAAYLANVDEALKEAAAALEHDESAILEAKDKERDQKKAVKEAKRLYDEAKEVCADHLGGVGS
jgi:hypothetical protein